MAATSGGWGSHAETLQKLERLNQLETVTAEQRIRIEKYRTMYETLKTEHDYLEEEKNRHLSEKRLVHEEMRSLEQQCQDVVARVRNDLRAKIEECEELKVKMLTPQKIDVLKANIQNEVEAPYRKKIEAMEGEVEKYQNEFNQLRYEYSFLKSEYEHEIAQKTNAMEELSSKSKMEKEALQNQVKLLNVELNQEEPGDKQKIRILQKENSQLKTQIKSLMGEIEEERDKHETKTMNYDQGTRLQVRQLSDMNMRVRTLESELETCRIQHDRVQKELNKSIQCEDSLTSDLHRVEKENVQLKNQIEDVNHAHKVEINNLRMCLIKERSELERDRDSLSMELKSFKNKMENLEANKVNLNNSLNSKDEEVMKRIQQSRIDDVERISKLEVAKADLEAHITTITQQKLESCVNLKNQLTMLDNQYRAEKEIKEKLEREIDAMKDLLTCEKERCGSLQQEVNKLQETKEHHTKLMFQHEHLGSLEKDAKDEVEKLSRVIEMLRREVDDNQQEFSKQNVTHQRATQELRSEFSQERTKLQQKYSEEHHLYKDLKKKYEKLLKVSKKKVKKLKLELASMSDQVVLMKTKENHCELEKQALKKNLDMEQERMRRRLDKLRQKQHQFSNVLNASNFQLPDMFKRSRMDDLTFAQPRSAVSPVADLFDSSHC